MRVAFFSDRPNPRWTDETLPIAVRKQILADELQRVTRLTQSPVAAQESKGAPSPRPEHAR